MAYASYVWSSFLGGEWSPHAQGRSDEPHYKTAMNVSYNGYPLEEGAWARRPGFIADGTTYNGYPGKVRKFLLRNNTPVYLEFTYNSGASYLRIWYPDPTSGVFRLLCSDSRLISAISTANPAVVTTSTSETWTTGQPVVFNLAAATAVTSAPYLTANRSFTITVSDGTDFSIVDSISALNIDGSTLNYVNDGTDSVGLVNVISLPYTTLAQVLGLRVAQLDDAMIIYDNTKQITPQILQCTNDSSSVALSALAFTLTAIDFTKTDGPYLDPFPGLSQQGCSLGSVDGWYTGTSSAANFILRTIVNFTVEDAAYTFTSTDVGRAIRLWTQPGAYNASNPYGTYLTANGSYALATSNGAYYNDWKSGSTVGPGAPQIDKNVTYVPWVPAPNAGQWVFGHITALVSGTTVTVQLENPDDQDTILTPASFTAATTEGSETITTTGLGDVNVGYPVTGPGIPPNTFLVSQSGGTSGTLNNAATATGSSVTLTLNTVTYWGGGAFTAGFDSFWFRIWSTYVIPTATATKQYVDIWQIGAYIPGFYPTNGTWHEGRLWQGGAYPNRFDGSVADAISTETLSQNPQAGLPYRCFAPSNDYGTVLDSSGISLTLNAPDLNDIRWMIPDNQGIILGTAGGEWIISASNLSDPLTPTSIQAHISTSYKGANVEPVRAGHAVVFVQANQRRVIEYITDFFSPGKLIGRHLNEWAGHIPAEHGGVQEIGYAEDRVPLLWARMGDGTLASCTYRRFSRFATEPPNCQAWARHQHGGGRTFQSIVVGPTPDGTLDTLAAITKDANGVYFFEHLTPTIEEGILEPNVMHVDTVGPPGPNGFAGTDSGTSVPSTFNTAGGQFYAEFTVIANSTNNGYWQFGVANSSASLKIWLGRDGNSAVQGFNSGNVWIAGASSGTDLTHFNVNDVFSIAVDTISNRVWFRNVTRDGSSWGGGDGSNPATGTGGWDISGISGVLYLAFGAVGHAGNDTVLLNAGASAFTGTVPTGFAAWDTTGLTGWNQGDSGSLSFVDSVPTTITQNVTVSDGNLEAAVTTTNHTAAQGGTFSTAASYNAGAQTSYYDLTHAAGVYYLLSNHHSPPYSTPVVDSQWQYNSVNIRTNSYKARS